jgi:hypothetical protein
MLGKLRYDATATVKTIGIPTLVVAANGDPVCKPEASERIHRDVPTAELTALNPAKHLGFMEHHTLFTALVTDCTTTGLRPALAEETANRSWEIAHETATLTCTGQGRFSNHPRQCAILFWT